MFWTADTHSIASTDVWVPTTILHGLLYNYTVSLTESIKSTEKQKQK